MQGIGAIYTRCYDAIEKALTAAGCMIPGASRRRPDQRAQFLNTLTVGLLINPDPRIMISTPTGPYMLTLKDNKPHAEKMKNATPAECGANYKIINDEAQFMPGPGSEARQ